MRRLVFCSLAQQLMAAVNKNVLPPQLDVCHIDDEDMLLHQ